MVFISPIYSDRAHFPVFTDSLNLLLHLSIASNNGTLNKAIESIQETIETLQPLSLSPSKSVGQNCSEKTPKWETTATEILSHIFEEVLAPLDIITNSTSS